MGYFVGLGNECHKEENIIYILKNGSLHRDILVLILNTKLLKVDPTAIQVTKFHQDPFCFIVNLSGSREVV